MREKRQRDRTVKNPSEAFNLLLQQNFISTLIFFIRKKRKAKTEEREEKMRSFYTIETNISCFSSLSFCLRNFFFTTMETLWQRPEKRTNKKKKQQKRILHKCIHVYMHILILFFFVCRANRCDESRNV